ncbi:Hypothetical predicted protein [Octopus vulgaris]|uniref:Uncharacterized protein n=1 Tax=Octopus vulgaris TaxID=6645 RepID=A0AA36F673_OCTVU|nr:Hypothetical predicted protein [Octopus vulgaris]
MKSYAEVTAEDREKEKLRKLTLESLNWDPEKMKGYLSKVELEATNVKLVMPEEKKKMLRDLTRVYRTFSNESRRIEIAPEFQMETMVKDPDPETWITHKIDGNFPVQKYIVIRLIKSYQFYKVSTLFYLCYEFCTRESQQERCDIRMKALAGNAFNLKFSIEV